MSFNVQYAKISPVLPFDIAALIIDIVGENNDMNLLKELALVSHSFHQITHKHLFATVDLHDDGWNFSPSSKKGFIKLVKSRPNVVNYIRKLTYRTTWDNFNDDDRLLSPILSSFRATNSRLNCLAISISHVWNELDSSLASAFLHLMHFPTINHIDLSNIENFPFSSLPRSVHRLDIDTLTDSDQPAPEIVFNSEMMFKIREFHSSNSFLLTSKLLHAKMQDGRPAFNFMDLRRLWFFLMDSDDKQNIRHLLRNAKLLEKLHLSVMYGQSLVGFHDILSPLARTLKVLSLSVPTGNDSAPLPALAGLCEELEAMAGHYMLEALFIEFVLEHKETADSIGSKFQKVEKVLVKPGWSDLSKVSFNVSFSNWWIGPKLTEPLQSLPDIYLSRLSKLESVSFNYTVSVEPDPFLLS